MRLLGEPCKARRSLGLNTLVDGASLVLWIGVGCECSGDKADRSGGVAVLVGDSGRAGEYACCWSPKRIRLRLGSDACLGTDGGCAPIR